MQDNSVESICNLESDLLMDIKGGRLYQQLLCEGILTNFKHVYDNYKDEMIILDEEQSKELFSFTPSEPSKRYTCLEAFHLTVVYAESYCHLMNPYSEGDDVYMYECVENQYDIALDNYDECMD